MFANIDYFVGNSTTEFVKGPINVFWSSMPVFIHWHQKLHWQNRMPLPHSLTDVKHLDIEHRMYWAYVVYHWRHTNDKYLDIIWQTTCGIHWWKSKARYISDVSIIFYIVTYNIFAPVLKSDLKFYNRMTGIIANNMKVTLLFPSAVFQLTNLGSSLLEMGPDVTTWSVFPYV